MLMHVKKEKNEKNICAGESQVEGGWDVAARSTPGGF